MAAIGLDRRKNNRGNTEALLKHRHQWPKGVSGNPTGRTRSYVDIERLCREKSLKAYETIVDLMDDSSPKIRLAASQEILTRAFGKPTLKVDPELDIRQVYLDALRDLAQAPSLSTDKGPILDVTPEPKSHVVQRLEAPSTRLDR